MEKVRVLVENEPKDSFLKSIFTLIVIQSKFMHSFEY